MEHQTSPAPLAKPGTRPLEESERMLRRNQPVILSMDEERRTGDIGNDPAMNQQRLSDRK